MATSDLLGVCTPESCTDSVLMTKLMDWLPKNIPDQIKTSVVHGDFRVDNLIFDKDDPSKVLAVLDWELSTLGDPLTDTAYGCMAHHIPSEMKMLKGLKGLNLKDLGIPTDLEYMKEYFVIPKLTIYYNA